MMADAGEQLDPRDLALLLSAPNATTKPNPGPTFPPENGFGACGVVSLVVFRLSKIELSFAFRPDKRKLGNR